MKKRIATVLLAAVLLLTLLPTQFTAVKAATISCKNDVYVKDAQLGTTGWFDNHNSSWVSAHTRRYVQGMAISGKYIYSAIGFNQSPKGTFKGDDLKKDVFFWLMRSEIGGGTTRKDKDILTFNGDKDLKILGHGNDLCAFTYGDYTYLFVTHGGTHLVLLTINGTKIAKYRKFKAPVYYTDGNDKKVWGTMGITLKSRSGSVFTFAVKNKANTPTTYTFKLDMSKVVKTAGITKNKFSDNDAETTLELTKSTKLGCNMHSKLKDIYGSFSSWSFQGFTYNRDNNQWYVPAFVTKSNGRNYSCYFVFNSSGKYVKYVKLSYSMEMEAMDFRGTRIYFTAISTANADTAYSGHNSILFSYKYQ